MFVVPQSNYLFPSNRLLQGIAIATNRLLTVKDYYESVQAALNALGIATNIDRIYIFENHPHPETGEPAISQRWEWVAEGVTAEIDNPRLQNLLYQEILPRWMVRRISLDAGGDDFLPKPIDAEDLLTLLGKHLQLNWRYQKRELGVNIIVSEDEDTNLVLPTIEDLQILLDLAHSGLLIKLEKTAAKIAQKNAEYLPFSQKISQLAKQFEAEKIEILLEKFIEQQQSLKSSNP